MSSQATPPVVTQAPPPPPPPRPYRRRRSWAGPIVLIVIGVVFLLKNLGYGFPLFETWAKWWPLLLILWGLVKIVEYTQAKREGEPAPGLGGGGVVLLVFIIIFGLISTGVVRVRQHWTENGPPGFVFNDNDLAQFFGTRYEYTDQLTQALPPNATLTVNVDRGDVRVLTGTDPQMHITVRKTVYAGNQNDAAQINQETKPDITTNGNAVTLQWTGQRNIRTDMEILLPRAVGVTVTANRGDLTFTGRDANLQLETNNGDVTVDDVKGNLAVHMRHGDLRSAHVTGAVTADGRINDATLADVTGAVSLSGDFFGDIQADRIGGGLTFRSSRTDLSMAKIDGTFRMSGDSVDASQITGPVRLVTRSKDVKFDQVTGDTRVETTNGDVEIGFTKLGTTDVQDRNSGVRLRIPANARFQVDAVAENGDITTTFPGLNVQTSGNTARLGGTVGNGGPRVQVRTEHADIAIQKE